MLKAVIIEDNFTDRQILTNLIEKYCKDEVTILGDAHDVDAGFLLINNSKPDIIFLDIELGNQSAFDLLSKFSKFSFQVIFVTAYDTYGINAIKFNAVDYLLKPVKIEELLFAIKKIKINNQQSFNEQLINLFHNVSNPHNNNNKIAIPILKGYKMVVIKDIFYCEANKEYTYIHCNNRNIICSTINLGEYELLLKEYNFCRVHHSFIVNKEHVKEYVKGEGGELLLEENIRLSVSRRKKEEVINWLTH